jgi:hypothetical protein
LNVEYRARWIEKLLKKNDKREKREFDKSHQSYQQQQTIVKF